MKNMTKKLASEQSKYVAIIDYFAGKGNNGYDYKELEAEDIFTAMDEAADLKTEDVYLVKIAEKVAYGADIYGIYYKAVLVNRSYNWHPATSKNSESENHYIVHYVSPSGKSNGYWEYALKEQVEKSTAIK